jgi:serine/threonine-protein kinase
VSRNGIATPLAAPLAAYQSPRVSYDGHRLLVTTETPTPDVWSYDMTTGVSTQLTFDSGATFPVWLPDGQRLVYSSTKSGASNLFMIGLTQPSPAERLAVSEHLQIPGSWSPDGATLAFVERRPSTGRDILMLSPRVDRTPRPLLVSAIDESAPRFSPDGRWLAYVSNQSGRNEVYVRPVADGGESRAISLDGGGEPVWAPNGRELAFRNGNMVIGVEFEGRDMRAARPKLLFEGDFARGTIDAANYDFMPDGQRFVMIQRQPQAAQPTLHVLMNWFSPRRGGAASAP